MNTTPQISPLNSDDCRPSDLLMLLPLCQHSAAGMTSAVISLDYLHQELSMLAHANDIPVSLREYFLKLGGQIGGVHAQLRAVQVAAKNEIQDFLLSARQSERSVAFSAAEIAKLVQVNSRLVELEKAIYTRIVDIHSHLHGLDSPALDGLKWDQWDGADVEMQLRFALDSERPSYYPDESGESIDLEQLSITVMNIHLDINDVKNFDPGNSEYWGLGDGEDHNDIHSDCDHPLAGLPLCFLFHELFDHADVGLRGMLHLEEIWFDVKLQQSGWFRL